MDRLILAAFCLSGFAGLMHQVVWAKLLAGLIGTMAHAQAVVLTVFMGGLALGSVFFGRRVDRRGLALRTYVILEVLIAAYCLLLPLLLRAGEYGYIVLAGYFFDSTTFTFLLRLCLALLLVLFPAVLMGGTLPVLSKKLVVGVEQTQRYVAALYSLNSLGAVLGAAAAGFVTLPLLGVHASLVVASLLNLGAAGLLLGPSRREAPLAEASDAPEVASQRKQSPPDPIVYGTDQYQATLLALALSGFAAMGYEVLFSRVIALSFGSSTYSFTVMLMSFITGISLGSAIVSRIRVLRPLWLFGASQLFVVVALLAVTPFVSRFPYLIGLLRIALNDAPFGFELFQLGKAALCLAVLLLPTTFLGFGFPLVAQIQARRSPDIGYRVGSTYAWNTAGNVIGTVVTSLVLLPSLGLLGAFHFNFALNLTAGLAVLLVATEVPSARRIGVGALTLLAAAGYLAGGTAWLTPINFAHSHLRLTAGPDPEASAEDRAQHPASSFDAWKRRFVIDPGETKAYHFEEDAQTTVLAFDDGDGVYLYVNGKPDASNLDDLPTQVLLAHLPLFLAPEARDFLVIGHGSGITVGSLTRHPVDRVDIVEISPGVLNADSLFTKLNYGVLADPRVHTYLGDGQNFLRAVPRLYDMIVSEPSNPWIAGIAGLFTVEFFEEMRGKLNPGGVAVLWFHEYEQSDEGVELVLRTIRAAFPYVLLCRSPDYADIIIVATEDPIEPDFAAMEDRFDRPEIRNDLARVGITNLATLLIHYALTPERLLEVLPPGPLNTVAHQRLEYSAPRSLFYDETSYFLEGVDPLNGGVEWDSSTMLDHYVAYRAVVGEPVRYEELSYVIGRSHPQVASRLAARIPRSQGSAGPPSRTARGLVPDPSTAGLVEAAYWSNRYLNEGRMEEAIPFSRRFYALERDAADE